MSAQIARLGRPMHQPPAHAVSRNGRACASATTGRFVRVDGLGTYDETHGSGEPLLLLHGGLCSAETFDAMIPGLGERFLVIAPERRGHGRTPDTDEPFTYDAMTVETVSFMDALGIASAHVVGHSDGGNVGLLLAIRHPERLRRLVSIGGNFHPSGIYKEPSPPRAVVAAQFAELRKDYQRLSPYGPDHLAVYVAKARPLWHEWAGIALGDLRSIDAPVLVMAADADLIKIEHTVQLFRALKNGQLAIVPNSNHFLTRERPDLVDELILDFLAAQAHGVPSRRRRGVGLERRWDNADGGVAVEYTPRFLG
jgi:pimeloyl-ACP methyl ester carboxylesterase